MSNRLLHTKLTKNKPISYIPSKLDGKNGDMQIVTIKNKGTFLCIKDKNDWKISDKFNQRYKAGKHEFDKLKVNKIFGASGLGLSIKSSSAAEGALAAKTYLETTIKKTIVTIGDGSSTGIISANGNQSLLLKSGDSTPAYMVFQEVGNITSSVPGTGAFYIGFDSDNAAAGQVKVRNTNTDGGNALIDLQVRHTNSDAYVRYSYFDNTASNDVQWALGFDGSDSDKFKLTYRAADSSTILTPSIGTTQLTIDASGNLSNNGSITAGTGGLIVDNITIDKNSTVTTTSSNKTMHIDYDQTGICASGQTIGNIGLDLDMNMESVTHVGIISQTGIDIDLVGATSGTQLNTGISIDVDGADSNTGIHINTAGTHIKLVANADVNDYSTITLANTGDLTIETVGSGTTDSDIILDADGNIVLDAASGNFIAKTAGAEFSAANSSYAGMILGYTRLEGDLTTQNSYEIQDAMTVEDDTHQITFKTPPSEFVEIELCCFIDIASTDTEINVGLSSASASSGYSALSAELEYDSGAGTYFSDDEVDDDIFVVKFVCKAAHLASIGSSNTFYIGFSTGGVTKTATIRYGLRASHGLCAPPMIIKATALPATIYDGQ